MLAATVTKPGQCIDSLAVISLHGLDAEKQ